MRELSKSRKAFIAISALIGAAVFLYAGSVLPRVTTDLFTSPDETAVMLFARAWSPRNGFQIAYTDPGIVSEIAGLRPRSTVQQGDVLVPVGFLGMPFLVAILEKVVRGSGAYLTLLLVLSSAYPLFQLARKRNDRVAIWTVLFYLTFPTVLLYVNRGLFPNLPVVALTIWAVYGVWGLGTGTWQGKRQCLVGALTGIAIGCAFLIRPTEAVWIVPWMVFFGLRAAGCGLRVFWKRFVIPIAVVIVVSVFGMVLAMQTYPFHSHLTDQPVVGYMLRDIVGVQGTEHGARDPSGAVEGSWSIRDYLPFGFHPRVMWENVKTYLFTYFGVWIAAALAGTYFTLRKKWKKVDTFFLFCVAWTVGVLLLFYGQALYTDNIRGGVTIGNSFLRYLLPLAPLLAFGAALFVDRVALMKYRGPLLAVLCSVFLVLLGSATAFARDEEGISKTKYELSRYVTIRQLAEEVVPRNAIILSERSDKIFASGAFIAVSPLPEKDTLVALSETDTPIYLFHRLIEDGSDAPGEISVVWPFGGLLFQLDNEGLYRLGTLSDLYDLEERLQEEAENSGRGNESL